MLKIENLKASYDGHQILNGVTLSLEKGDSLAIIGESGAGKTTLGMSVMGLLNGSCSGKITFQGRDMLSLSENERRKIRGKEISMVFQNVEDALDPLYKISDQIAEAVRVHEGGEDAVKRALNLLESMGLDERKANSYPHQLSGGEKQRALITMALANDPEVVILDEPTASLDAISKADITWILRELTSEKISLVITHDISAASKLADNMAVLYAGRIVEIGPTKSLLENPRHPYTRGLIRSSPNMTSTKDLQGIPGRMVHGVKGCPFHERCTQRIDMCSKEVPPLVDADNGRKIACHRGGIVPLLELNGLEKCFESFKAVDGIDLTLYEGETIALVGESGSGKTTLAKMIIGLLTPDTGEIQLEGETVGQRSKEFYNKVQMIYQNPKESISHRMNVLDAVREPLDVQNIGRPKDRVDRVKRVLEEVELSSDDDFLGKYPHQISGGEAQRVAIARALVLNPKLLIADEPTSALDASVQAKILKLLLNLQEKRGLSILFVTHDIAVARKVSDRMAVMLKGRIIEEGPTSQIMTYPTHPYTEKLLEAAPDISVDPRLGSRPEKRWIDSWGKDLVGDERPLITS